MPVTHKTLTGRQQAALAAFLRDCGILGLRPFRACVSPREATERRLTQIRSAGKYLALASDNSLGNFVVLTTDLRILNLLDEEI